jgi:hypothetical protein
MQQLSRPYQIALGALLVFALAWFTVLKPSGAADEVAPLPGPSAAVSAPGAPGLDKAVDKANGAAAASDANAAASQAAAAAATGETAAAPSSPAPATATSAPAKGAPAAAPPSADPSAPILRAVAGGKTAVVLFSSAAGADDRAVRRALKAVDRRDGKVVVRAVPIARVAEYAAITEGVDVLQSPTLLVIGENNRARTLVGLTDTRAIDQMVADMRR